METSKSDIKGKKIFYNFIQQRKKAKNIKFTEDIKDKIDVIVDNSTVELKYRPKYNYNSSVIQNQGVLLEKDKVDYALKTIKDSGYTNSYYCVIYPDNVISFFDFKLIDKFKPFKKELPIYTEFEQKGKRTKEIYIIPTSYFKTYSY